MSESRLEGGSSSIQDETEDVEEQPLVRHRSRRMSSGSVESAQDVGATEDSAPSSPGEQDMGNHPRHSGSVFPTDEVSFFLSYYKLWMSSRNSFLLIMLVNVYTN